LIGFWKAVIKISIKAVINILVSRFGLGTILGSIDRLKPTKMKTLFSGNTTTQHFELSTCPSK